MHTEILSDRQRELLPFVSQFKRSFYLVGDTAIALYLGHRFTNTLELFSPNKINKPKLRLKVVQVPYKRQLLVDEDEQLAYILNEVKIKFVNFGYKVEHPIKFNTIITAPSLLTLAAIKAHEMENDRKWENFVDMYFIVKGFFSVGDVVKEAQRIFGSDFSEDKFRNQLQSFENVKQEKEIEFAEGNEVAEEEVKEFLREKATEEV
jgi:hypothetical protein